MSTIEDIVQPYIAAEKTKALSVATYQDGKIEYLNFGICSDENPVAPTQNSLYEIGSITKTFTGTVLAEMVEEGKVEYDDPIAKYLPEGTCNWSDDKSITLAALSTHTSGLPRIPNNMLKRVLLSPDNPYKNYTVADMYDFLKDYEPTDKAQRKCEYSNLGVGLLGHILALVDSRSYEEMIRVRIFQPLAMDNSTITLGSKSLIQGHDGAGNPTSPWDLPTLAGAGAIRSTTEDMMKYLVANITEQEPYVQTHAPRESMSDFQKIGLGWISQTNEDLAFTWHNGGTGGFRTFMGFSKDSKVGVIVLANSVQGVDEIGIRIMEFLAAQ